MERRLSLTTLRLPVMAGKFNGVNNVFYEEKGCIFSGGVKGMGDSDQIGG